MSRVQLALNVDDLDEAITFYSRPFNTAPAKVKEGYANFAIAEPPLKLVLLQNTGQGGTINHLGVEVTSSEQVHAEIAPPLRRGTVHRRGDRHHLLFRHPGQGLGDRPGRGEVGGLHRACRFGHLRLQPPAPGGRRPERSLLRRTGRHPGAVSGHGVVLLSA
jgi:catechol 2,3-dioxygenase-like lactoylglutathione lyase family enzyme